MTAEGPKLADPAHREYARRRTEDITRALCALGLDPVAWRVGMALRELHGVESPDSAAQYDAADKARRYLQPTGRSVPEVWAALQESKGAEVSYGMEEWILLAEADVRARIPEEHRALLDDPDRWEGLWRVLCALGLAVKHPTDERALCGFPELPVEARKAALLRSVLRPLRLSVAAAQERERQAHEAPGAVRILMRARYATGERFDGAILRVGLAAFTFPLSGPGDALCILIRREGRGMTCAVEEYRKGQRVCTGGDRPFPPHDTNFFEDTRGEVTVSFEITDGPPPLPPPGGIGGAGRAMTGP